MVTVRVNRPLIEWVVIEVVSEDRCNFTSTEKPVNSTTFGSNR